MSERYRCLVCGYPGFAEPPRSLITGSGMYEICVSCNFQFGYDDDARGWTDEAWRAQWVAEGMPWRGVSEPAPPGWDPQAQLDALLQG